MSLMPMPDHSSTIVARVTIGIVTYNSAAVIGDTLRSLIDAHRGDRDVAILVWDNRSTDGTVSIVRSIAEGRGFIRLVEGDDNPGYGIAHNRILSRVESDFHVVCNPDILIFGGTIETCIRFLDENSGVGLVDWTP